MYINKIEDIISYLDRSLTLANTASNIKERQPNRKKKQLGRNGVYKVWREKSPQRTICNIHKDKEWYWNKEYLESRLKAIKNQTYKNWNNEL